MLPPFDIRGFERSHCLMQICKEQWIVRGELHIVHLGSQFLITTFEQRPHQRILLYRQKDCYRLTSRILDKLSSQCRLHRLTPHASTSRSSNVVILAHRGQDVNQKPSRPDAFDTLAFE